MAGIREQKRSSFNKWLKFHQETHSFRNGSFMHSFYHTNKSNVIHSKNVDCTVIKICTQCSKILQSYPTVNMSGYPSLVQTNTNSDRFYK